MTAPLARTVPAALLALGVLACAERPRAGSVALHLAAGTARQGALVTRGRDSILVRRAELVLSEVQLAPKGSGECDPEEKDEEACTPLEMGPVLVTLPLDTPQTTIATVRAPVDTFIVFHFALYRPDSSQDAAFLATHPEFAGTSIRVQGTYSRAGKRSDFVYTSGFTEQHETALEPPIEVSPDSTLNVTLRFAVANWFLNADKTALIDPATAQPGAPNQDLVHDNIRMSVAAFGDAGHDSTLAAGPSPWPAVPDSIRETQPNGATSTVTASAVPPPQCRRDPPRITSDSIGPFRLDASLSDLQRECPGLAFSWTNDPDGYPVPAVAARLGGATVTAWFTDTLAGATVREVRVERGGLKTAEGLGVGSTLRDLQRAYGAAGASEPDCVLRVWFAALPGVAFRMAFSQREQRECGGLSEEPLPPDLRVASVILVPR
ncbi:MAG TPA: hypothetical protein VJ755_01815 [Gemmatimonadales bacterium]|nr:hypothetical protein [Gemmatimonadales bacterium]